MRDWWRSLERAPESLSGRQRWAVVAASVLAAASRLPALARTPWDWDEMLFMQGLDAFDVARHRPQPPGFPLYILAGKALRRLGFSDFHALQLISIIAGMAIVPVMFFLCRELRLRFSTALGASVLLAFFPNVWLYGGGAFSDVPAMTLIILAIALLLAGCRDSRAYLGGAALLGVAAGIRPQALLVGFAPFLIATAFQSRRRIGRVCAAIAMIAGITVASYGAAAWLTGWTAYRSALAAHSDYIERVDSFRSPLRPPLWRVFDDFFVMPYHAPPINATLTFLVLISAVATLVRRRPAVLTAIAAFGPFCLFTWLVLDRFSASRFSIAYAPLMAILAADGLRLVLRRPAIELAGACAIAGWMIAWSWPALRQNRSVTPPVAAMEWIRSHGDSRRSIVDVDPTMIPFAEWFLPDYRLQLVARAPDASWIAGRPEFLVGEGTAAAPAVSFVRPHGRLWDIVRRRYFAVSVRPVPSIRFGDGWYGQERLGSQIWRWMGARSVAILPPLRGDARLRLAFHVPLEGETPPTVTIRINGAIVDRFRAAANEVQRSVIVHDTAGEPVVLQIETDRVMMPSAEHLGSDARSLGLRLDSIEWTLKPVH